MEIQQDGSSLLLNIYKNGKWSDLTIINKDKEYNVHKVVLCNTSPYLDEKISSDSSGHVIKLDFPTLLFDTIIEWAYCGKILIKKENAVDLFHLADQMQITGLTNELSNFLWDHFSDSPLVDIEFWINTILKKMKNADTFMNSYWRFMQHIRSNFLDIVHTDVFLDFDGDTVAYMIDLNGLNIDNEMQVFEAIIRWIERNMEIRSIHLSKLLKKVHWADINASQFMNRIDSLPWIMKCDQARHVIIAAVELVFYKSMEQMQVYDLNFKPRHKSSNTLYCINRRSNYIITIESIGKSETKAFLLTLNPDLPAAKFTDLYVTEHIINSDSIIRIDWRKKTYRLFKEPGSCYSRLFDRTFKFSTVDKKVHLCKGDRSIEFAPFFEVGWPIRTVTKDKGHFYSTSIVDVTPVRIYNPSDTKASSDHSFFNPHFFYSSHDAKTKQKQNQNSELKFKLYVKLFNQKEAVWDEIASWEIITQEKIKVLKSTIFHDLMVILMDQLPILIYNFGSQSFEEYTNTEIVVNELSDLHFVHDSSNLIIYHRAGLKEPYKKAIFEICDGRFTLVKNCKVDGIPCSENILGFISLGDQDAPNDNLNN